jgi:hypothetical protein
MDLRWARTGDPEYRVIPVTALLHSLENNERFPVVISVINDPSPCDPGVKVYTDLWNPDKAGAGSFLTAFIEDGSPVHEYNRDVSCQWSFAIKHGKMKLFRIYVEYFDMELSPDCHYDGVRVRAGADSDAAVLALYCGYYAPGHLLFEEMLRGMFVEFYTDDLYEFGGAKLRWEVHDCERCDSGPRPTDRLLVAEQFDEPLEAGDVILNAATPSAGIGSTF